MTGGGEAGGSGAGLVPMAVEAMPGEKGEEGD